MGAGAKRDPGKERHWRAVVAEQAGSGLSVEAFCQSRTGFVGVLLLETRTAKRATSIADRGDRSRFGQRLGGHDFCRSGWPTRQSQLRRS